MMTSGVGLGVCPKRESVFRNAQKTNNAFYGGTKGTWLALE